MGNPTTCQTNSASARVTPHAPAALVIAGPSLQILPANHCIFCTRTRPLLRPAGRGRIDVRAPRARGLPGWRSWADYADYTVRHSRDGTTADIVTSTE